VRRVKGDTFENSRENLEVLVLVEQMKNQHLLNAISVLLNEFPEFGRILEGPLADNGIQIPSRPVSAADRPATGSSQRSR
jgi:hypothetical protein